MKGIVIFLSGAAVGSVTSWLISKYVYKKKLSEVRNIYAELTEDAKKKEEPEPMEEVAEVISSAGYSSVNIPGYWERDYNPEIMNTADAEAPVEKIDNEPYMIAAGRFEGDPKYEKHYLIYSTDQDELYEGDEAIFTVYDSNGEPEDLTTTDILGNSFMEEALYIQGADIVHVRNESLQMDFEVEIIR